MYEAGQNPTWAMHALAYTGETCHLAVTDGYGNSAFVYLVANASPPPGPTSSPSPSPCPSGTTYDASTGFCDPPTKLIPGPGGGGFPGATAEISGVVWVTSQCGIIGGQSITLTDEGGGTFAGILSGAITFGIPSWDAKAVSEIETYMNANGGPSAFDLSTSTFEGYWQQNIIRICVGNPQ